MISVGLPGELIRSSLLPELLWVGWREVIEMMDKEAGAKTRHVVVVVRRFQDTHSYAGSLLE
jgi:hypothetical protein